MQSLSCPSKHESPVCSVCPAPAWLGPLGLGTAALQFTQLPQPRKWLISHAGWSQKNICTNQTGVWMAILKGESAWIQDSRLRTVVCVWFLAAGGCATRGHRASQGTCPLCWAWSCVTGTHPMSELVGLGQIQTFPALSWKHGMWKITARRLPVGGAAMSVHVNSQMFTFTFKGFLNSFHFTILHVSMWPSSLQAWYCLQGLGLRLYPGEVLAGEGICSVTFDVRHSPG